MGIKITGWRRHPVFHDYYISKSGKVARKRKDGSLSLPEGALDRHGYRYISITHKGKNRKLRVHQAVALTWRGPKPTPNHVVRHKNGIRDDNRAANILWGTPQENADDRDLHGNTQRGEKHYRAKLTEKDIKEIRSVPHYYGIKVALGKKYGVSDAMIGYIRRNEFWKHV